MLWRADLEFSTDNDTCYKASGSNSRHSQAIFPNRALKTAVILWYFRPQGPTHFLTQILQPKASDAAVVLETKCQDIGRD